MCVPVAGRAALGHGCVCLWGVVCVRVAETSVVGVCLDHGNVCVCACVRACTHVRVDAWVSRARGTYR